MTDDNQTPIGGDTKVFALGEMDYYDKKEGDFDTRKFAKVQMGEGVSANDVGMVVDLLNEYGPEAIRNKVLDE